MNKLVEQLKQRAQSVVGEGLGGNYYDLDEDKFAELLIRECSEHVAKCVMRDKYDTIPRDPHSVGWNEGVAYVSKELLAHFGIDDEIKD